MQNSGRKPRSEMATLGNDADGRITLVWIPKKHHWMMGTRFILVRVSSNGGLLWRERYWT